MTLPYKTYLWPKQVNQVFQEMLEATQEPVSMQELATELWRRGVKNPRTGRGPSRMAVWELLRHAENTEGQKLVELSKSRATVKGRIEQA